VTSGTADAQIDVGAGLFSDRYRPGSMTLQMPNKPALFNFSNSLHGLILSVPISRAQGILEAVTNPTHLDALGPLHTRSNHDGYIERTLHAIWEELAEESPQGTLFIDHAVSALMFRLLGLASGLQQDVPRGGLASCQVKRIVEYLDAHLDQDVTLAQLTRLVGLSSTAHFCRAFGISTGMPPYRWLLKRRVERARILLSTTGLSITTIAFACGFSSSQHLATVFGKEVGVSPTQYRRTAQK
jgi:AraC family transcriptional regulator